MIIGITGTDGAGKGEKWDGTHFARPCQLVCEVTKKTSDKVYCACKAPGPNQVNMTQLNVAL